MKKLMILGMGVCVALSFTSCKSSESAYKKAYEKAMQQETTVVQQETVPVEKTPTVTAPVVVERTPVAPEAGVRQEKVTVEGSGELKEYSVVCGSFNLKANAEALRDYLKGQGYHGAVVVFSPDAATYRVIVESYSDRVSAAAARDAFKRRYSNRQDFQGSWLLYRL